MVQVGEKLHIVLQENELELLQKHKEIEYDKLVISLIPNQNAAPKKIIKK